MIGTLIENHVYEKSVNLEEMSDKEIIGQAQKEADEILHFVKGIVSVNPKEYDTVQQLAHFTDLPSLHKSRKDEWNNTLFYESLSKGLLDKCTEHGINARVDLFSESNEYNNNDYLAEQDQHSNEGLLYHFKIERAHDETSQDTIDGPIKYSAQSWGRVQVEKTKVAVYLRSVGDIYLIVEKVPIETAKESLEVLAANVSL